MHRRKSKETNLELEADITGVICVKDVFPIEGDSDIQMPTEVLDLVIPLSVYVDTLLNEAILACDPDKADKETVKVRK